MRSGMCWERMRAIRFRARICELTIDSNIQYMAEQALDKQMAKVKAAHGTIVVQDPNTGQILALAVSPRFNPNDALHVDPQDLTDLAVSDVYEPGSTFKLVTYSAAIDAAGVKPTDMVDMPGRRDDDVWAHAA